MRHDKVTPSNSSVKKHPQEADPPENGSLDQEQGSRCCARQHQTQRTMTDS